MRKNEDEKKQSCASSTKKTFLGKRILLGLYDLFAFLVISFLELVVFLKLPYGKAAIIFACGVVSIFVMREICLVYRQIWRYGKLQSFIRLMLADLLAFVLYVGFFWLFRGLGVFGKYEISTINVLVLVSVDLLAAISMRMVYSLMYTIGSKRHRISPFLRTVLHIFTGMKIIPDAIPEGKDHGHRIRVAIVGAGRVGVSLCEELRTNRFANYRPVCFVDTDREKINRQIFDLPVFSEKDALEHGFDSLQVQEVFFALPQMNSEQKKGLYETYRATGRKVKVYDYPSAQSVGSDKRSIREFSVEELLFRKPIELNNEKTASFYRGKVVLITGGGGSIGSELCRQIATMSPKELVILDVYENGAYDVQQELKIAYQGKLNVCVEIVSVCDRVGLEKIFEKHHPNIVLHAAAHKHVPLMERNCAEAVKNNVFGTLNTVETSEKFGVERFMMVSTDKAVNPTNVMGATKRMCEMIVLSHAQTGGKTTFSATRFGNVLGSAGSVIPLFKRQIASGGPITITDKRIIRYFMTIPEASQLVLESGAMAKNGELYVLDMGKPIHILELAENMIRLSGLQPYNDIDIVETGLRPGEKLYEELLIDSETLGKTDNKMIFVETDRPISGAELEEKLTVLRRAVSTENDETVRQALHEAVPTFRTSEEVNREAEKAKEMKFASTV